jgi:hypothetical protein
MVIRGKQPQRWAAMSPATPAPYEHRRLAEMAIAGLDVSGYRDKAAVARAKQVAEARRQAQAEELLSPPTSPVPEARRVYPLRSQLRPLLGGDERFSAQMVLLEFTEHHWQHRDPRPKNRLPSLFDKEREVSSGVVWRGLVRIKSRSICPDTGIVRSAGFGWALETNSQIKGDGRGAKSIYDRALSVCGRQRKKRCKDAGIPFVPREVDLAEPPPRGPPLPELREMDQED